MAPAIPSRPTRQIARDSVPVITRRGLLTAGLSIGAGTLAAPATAEASPGPFIRTDTTVREHGPVMFLGDSVSLGRARSLPQELAAAGVGPFRVDLQMGRSISRDHFGWGRNAVQAVRYARSKGFDPPAFVVALGWVDILAWAQNPRPVRTASGTVKLKIGRAHV